MTRDNQGKAIGPHTGSELVDTIPAPYDKRRNNPKSNPPIALPPEYEQILGKTLAPNGLAYHKVYCKQCGYHIADQAILIGCIRKKCPNCKYPNEIDFNRVGSTETVEYVQETRTPVRSPNSMED